MESWRRRRKVGDENTKKKVKPNVNKKCWFFDGFNVKCKGYWTHLKRTRNINNFVIFSNSINGSHDKNMVNCSALSAVRLWTSSLKRCVSTTFRALAKQSHTSTHTQQEFFDGWVKEKQCDRLFFPSQCADNSCNISWSLR